MMNPQYIELLGRITAFVNASPDIHCLALIGSQAGSPGLADEYSDLDVLLVVENVDVYFGGETWLDAIGEKWIVFKEAVPAANFFERRAIFQGGLDVDFVLVEEAILKDDPDRLPILKEICGDKVQVLVDRNRLSPCLESLKTTRKPFAWPTQAEFSNLTGDFYFHCLWSYKKLLRGETWVALRCIDTYLRARLLTMLEWYEHACHGSEYDTFYEGRYLERWLDPELLPEIAGLFSRYDPDEMEQTLKNTLEFFTRIAKVTAERMQYPFPEAGRQKIAAWMEEQAFRKMNAG